MIPWPELNGSSIPVTFRRLYFGFLNPQLLLPGSRIL
jgi:hypothetical protein